MIQYLRYNIVCLTLGLLFISCAGTQTGEYNDDNPLFKWEQGRKAITEIDDLVLMYAGGAHRPYVWTKELVDSYVTYTDKAGKEHWLFDGFLFLEIFDSVNEKIFATGYKGNPAVKSDWQALLDYYFKDGIAISAVEKSVNDAKLRLGEPNFKHKIVISIPEPIATVSSWGRIDDEIIDFTRSDEQRMKAVKWYIDYARKKFDEAKLQNVELAGFYWVAETATHTRTILNEVAKYLNDMNYSFNWIPYWNADGYKNWKDVAFNYAYLQPNYFFNDKIEYSRLDDACKLAIEYNMDMEVEFDEGVLVDSKQRAYRLQDYMKAFREHDIIKTKRLAYYQGGTAVDRMKKSDKSQDNELYHEFCKFVLDHRQFMNNK